MSSSPVSTATPATGRRPTLPAGLALTGAAITFTSLYLAAGALMPLLVVYKQQWDLPAALLTLAFAVFAIGFLAAVLTLGSLSDHVGRRPVLMGALIIQLASNVMFLRRPRYRLGDRRPHRARLCHRRSNDCFHRRAR